MEKQTLHIPEQLQQICNSQLEAKIKSGFPTRLGISEKDFEQSYSDAIDEILYGDHHSDGLPTLVEPRIPFFEQARLSGISIDPAVFYTPVCDRERKPYGVWVKVVGKEDELVRQGLRFDQVVRKLPNHLRSVTPYEGIGTNIDSLLQRTFVIFPGGTYESALGITGSAGNIRALTLERFLGIPRITHYYLDFYDSLGGLLTAYK